VREAMFSISLISRSRCARSFSISSKTSSGERMVQSFFNETDTLVQRAGEFFPPPLEVDEGRVELNLPQFIFQARERP